MSRYRGQALVDGTATGPVLALAEPVSFWGGVDPDSGLIVDRNHPQAGARISEAIVLMSGSRGSSSASSVLAEMIRLGTAPAALVLTRRDPILVLGAVVAEELYGAVMPIVVVDEVDYQEVAACPQVAVLYEGFIEKTG